jgi:REP element-mobilizing transposase RayT
MAYPPRIQETGMAFHASNNAVDGCKLFRDDEDRQTFLSLLQKEIQRSDWSCVSYVLMTTHYHLIVKLNKCTLSSGFQHFHATYARTYNAKYGRRGTLWKRRVHTVEISSHAQMIETIRYLALNPTRADMCDCPEEHIWSSYSAAIGRHPRDPLVDEAELLGLFDRRDRHARKMLSAFVDERDPRVRRSQRRV